MNRPRVFVLVAVGLSAALSLTPALGAQAPSGRVGTDADHARLLAMCGTWNVEVTFWFQPGRPPIATKGISTIRALLDGLFIEEKIDGTLNGKPFTTLSWTGFNTDAHKYEATRIARTNPMRIAETGAYDEKANHIQPFSTGSMMARSYLSFGTVAEWKAVEIRYTHK